jgi:hypothetical protein
MNLLQEKALYHLTGQMKNGDLAGVSLEKIVSNYPYFGPAQSLLACHYHTVGHPLAAEQSARATLFYNNPRWWAFQLEEAIQSNNEQPVSTVFMPVQSATPAISNFPELPDDTPDPLEAISFTPPDEPEISQSFTIPTVEAVKEILRKIDGGILDNMPNSGETPLQTASEPVPGRLTQLLQSQLSSFQQPVQSTDKLDYQQAEPMHTVDYFASQGIKLNLKQTPKDGLTNKLLSFTDWLRQVKQSEKSTEVSQMEKKVSEDASHSVRKEEVVTEAMAEVLLRQGHREQAIQLFTKLSFQIPEKSSYFAGRIEQIKALL